MIYVKCVCVYVYVCVCVCVSFASGTAGQSLSRGNALFTNCEIMSAVVTGKFIFTMSSENIASARTVFQCQASYSVKAWNS